MQLSSQAWVLTGVFGALLLTLIVMGAVYMPGLLPWLVLHVLLMGIAVYDTECLVRGGCTVWSWVRTIFYSIVPVLFIIIALSVALGGGGGGSK